MGNYKGPTEGGSGGKRGHSNMEHWVETEELKKWMKSRRRKEDKEIVKDQLDERDRSKKDDTLG